MPAVATVDALLRAAAAVAVADFELTAEPAALAAARQSLDSSGLLLVGELHGAAENPKLIRALMVRLGLTSVALEWDEGLGAVIDSFLADGTLADHELLWMGDGRITAGHLAALAERAAAGPLRVILFDGTIGADWSWTQRDEAMARRLLARSPPEARTLVIAGNAHTPVQTSSLGVPLGAQLAAARPGVREIRVRYGGGTIYNMEPVRLHDTGRARQPALSLRRGELVLALPSATEAVVPQRRSSLPVRRIR